MTDYVEHGRAIATRLRAEAVLADRPGQMNRLEAEADSVDRLANEVERLRALSMVLTMAEPIEDTTARREVETDARDYDAYVRRLAGDTTPEPALYT